MAITDRDPLSLSAQDLEQLTALEPDRRIARASAPSDPSAAPALSLAGRVLVGTLSAAAGVIHVAMVPAHAAEWLPEGIAFAVAGWLQIGLAVAIVARGWKVAVRLASLASVAFIAAWVVSRIWGLPFGPEAGIAHGSGFVDITCVAIEAALVVAGYELLVRPDRGARLSDASLTALSVVPLGVLAFTTAAIVSPSAASHSHGGESAGHSHGTEAAASGSGGTATAATVAADGHGHDHGDGAAATGAPEDDKGLSLLMNGQGEGGGHTHDTSVKALDADTQAKLDAQLAKTQKFVKLFPTVKDAEAAGYTRQGPYSPGLGTHYSNASGVSMGPTLSDEDLEHPTLIYDGVEPESKLAGFMYNIFSMDTQNPPEGFVGPNDHWHFHTNVCLVRRPGGGIDAPLGADTSAPKELCDKYGGAIIANTGYMVHVWTVPGYESPQGLFSNLNAKMTCPNGTYYTVAMEEIGTRKNVCRDVAA